MLHRFVVFHLEGRVVLVVVSGTKKPCQKAGIAFQLFKQGVYQCGCILVDVVESVQLCINLRMNDQLVQSISPVIWDCQRSEWYPYITDLPSSVTLVSLPVFLSTVQLAPADSRAPMPFFIRTGFVLLPQAK